MSGVGSGTSLSSKVAAVQNAPNLTSECNKIAALVDEINAEAHSGAITPTQAAALLASANDVSGTLGC